MKTTIFSLPLMKIPEEIFSQSEKILEEVNELLNADSRRNYLEELFDTLQATLNLFGLETNGFDLIKSCEKHREKIKERGWELKGKIVIEIIEDA